MPPPPISPPANNALGFFEVFFLPEIFWGKKKPGGPKMGRKGK